jgi:hypothetical protein
VQVSGAYVAFLCGPPGDGGASARSSVSLCFALSPVSPDRPDLCGMILYFTTYFAVKKINRSIKGKIGQISKKKINLTCGK